MPASLGYIQIGQGKTSGAYPAMDSQFCMEALHYTAKPCLDFDMESTGLNMESTEVRALLVLDMESTEVRALLDWIGYGKH